MIWHRGRTFDLSVDTRRGVIRCPVVLPLVAARSAMYRELRAFVKAYQDPERPAHRRIDRQKASVTCAIRSGNVSLAMTVVGGEYEYAVRKFIHLIQEIYLVFLSEHFDYQVEAFDLDPDRP